MVARRRYQAGCLFKRGKRRKVWVARWREDVLLESGQLGRLHKSVVLGLVADLPTRRDALTKLEEHIRPVNQGTTRPEAMMSFGVFAETQWSALVLPTLKLSTQHGYKNVLTSTCSPTGACGGCGTSASSMCSSSWPTSSGRRPVGR